MKNMRQMISTCLVLALILSLQMGAFSALAEQPPVDAPPLTETLPTAITADGHIDGDNLKQWVDAYLKENWSDHPHQLMSIAFWYSDTDEYWFYNADEWMYAVNWYKLPVCMYYSEKLASGEMTKEDIVTGITLEYALNTVLEFTSAPSMWSLLTHLNGELGADYHDIAKEYAGLPDSYYDESYYSGDFYTSRLMMEITKTLYEGGEERFPTVLRDMKKSQPDDFFNRDWIVNTSYDVAQQHVAYWGGGTGDFIHCTGVIYTPSPIVLTIMTKNIADMDLLGGVTGHLCDLALDMYLLYHPDTPSDEAAAAENAADSSTENGTGVNSQDAGATGTATVAGDPSGTLSATPSATADQASGNTGTAATPDASLSLADPQTPAVTPLSTDPQTSAVTPAPTDSQVPAVTPAPIESQPPTSAPAPTEVQAPAESLQLQTESRKSSFLPILVLLIILLLLIAVTIALIIIQKRKERERRRRQALLRKKRERQQREREMRERAMRERDYDE